MHINIDTEKYDSLQIVEVLDRLKGNSETLEQ